MDDISPNVEAVGRSFLHEAILGASLSTILAVVGALLVLALAVSIFRSIRANRRKFIPAGWIVSPKEIRQLIGEAMAQRSIIELQLIYDMREAGRILRLSIHDISRGNILIAADNAKNAAERWTGRTVNCYFKVVVKDQPVYYNFRAAVKEVTSDGDGMGLLVLSIPEKLQNRQKRAFLRIEPPAEYLIGAALWLGWHVPSDGALKNIKEWSKPSLALLPGKKEQFALANISAGGAGLNIAKDELCDARHEFHVSDQLLILLDLLDPETRKRLRLSLLARVQYLTEEYGSKNLIVGLKFLSWALPQDDNSAQLNWLKLTSDSEVPPLGNWIVRRHLEMFRQHPELELEVNRP